LGDFIDAAASEEGDERFRTQVCNPVINAEATGARNIAYPRVSVEVSLGELVKGFDAIVVH